MIYHVTADLKAETAAELFAKLTDGSIANQRPDGPELVASMKRAVVNSEGKVEWSEMCFCPSPLYHERTTVLDLHFDDITTEPIEAHDAYEGTPFMEHLRALT
ncbi:MAG: hypothetical protein QNJ16_08270 [Rhodobacter sp.]|nr:hypothetical protein [Rhodobacter sp.]